MMVAMTRQVRRHPASAQWATVSGLMVWATPMADDDVGRCEPGDGNEVMGIDVAMSLVLALDYA